MSNLKLVKLLLAAVAAAAAFSAQAALVVYTAADDNVSSLAQMTNSVAKATQFDLDNLGFETVIDFEGPLPAGVSISGGNITNNSGCGSLCGFNTTLGGSFFLNLFGGSATFNFAIPIHDFGFYITGLQTNLVPQETLTFNDGSSQTINTPAAINGGGAFIGFTDFGKSIVSVTYNATNDIVSIDDVRFSLARAVPEPGSLALVSIAALALGALRRRRRC